MSWACEVVFPTCKPQGNSSQGADPHSLILNLPRFQPVTGTSEIRWIRWIWATDSNAVNTLTVIRAFSLERGKHTHRHPGLQTRTR